MKKIYLLFILISLSFTCIAQPPWVHFVADHTTPTPELTVTFTDLSWFAPYAWEWVFTPNTVTYMEGDQFSQNPKVRFNEYTKYTVQLTATNSFGSGIKIKEDYIQVRYPLEIGINEDGASGYVNVQVRVNSGELPNATNLIEDIEFGIMWNKVIINGNKIDLDLACDDVNPYHLTPNSSPVPHNVNGWDFRIFELINGTDPFIPPDVWVYDEWVTIVQLQVYPRTPGDHEPQGQFLILPSKDHFGNSNKDIDPIMKFGGIVYLLDTLPETDPMGSPWLSIPTNIHGYRWVGGRGSGEFDDYSWSYGPNWSNGCGDDGAPAAIPPGIYDDCIIPNVDDASNCYPRYTKPTNPTELIAVGQDIDVAGGGRIEWMNNLSSTERVVLQTQGRLNIDYTSNVSVYAGGLIEVGGDSIGWIAPLKIMGDTGLRVKSGGWLNTKYTTAIEGDSALIIEADEFGVGSFINEGAISYSNGGTAKVETFVTGTVGDYFMHFVGPTVEDTADGYNNSVRLQQFDMTTLDTYAFEWNPLVDPDLEQPWVNVWPFEYEVPLGNGLTLSNYEAGEGTIEMVGKIIDSPITYYAQSFTNNDLELISNPYSSAIDFDEFAFLCNNENIIYNRYYIYDASTGNWITRTNFGGDQQYLQVGQGFFVEIRQSGNITFDTSLQVHNSTDPFRELIMNRLTLDVTGGTQGFSDKLFINFHPDATIDYDEELDAIKWNSYSSGATMIRSIAEDGSELAINTMPLVDMNSTLTSIPVHFECGEDAEYTFAFKGLDSFDFGAEVWLEDKLSGSNWYSLANNEEEYSFLAAPDDQKDRFIIHFFGPTYTPEDIDVKSNHIKIYASGNDAYIVNNSDEKIKEITIYNMLGQEVVKVKVPAQNIHKLEVKGQTGYYAVRVLTDKNLYSEKVFIKRN